MTEHEDRVVRAAVAELIATGRRTMKTSVGRVTIIREPRTEALGRLEVRLQQAEYTGGTVQTPEGVVPTIFIKDKIYTLEFAVTRYHGPRLQRREFDAIGKEMRS